MLSDFTKLETFAIVIREKSFSKASAKLGISQPAVTQQIKYIEDYLGVQVLQRRKSGIRPTKEGEELLKIVQKLQKCINIAEKDLIRIINKDITFVFSTSYVVGNYVLPVIMEEIKNQIKNEVMVNVSYSNEAVEQLLDKKSDMALIESPFFRDGVIYREWLEDEIVVFSNQKIPKRLEEHHLDEYKWVCREESSHIRILFKEALEKLGMNCEAFNRISESTSATAIVQTVLHAPINGTPTVSIASRRSISDEIDSGRLFEARIKGGKIKRNLYIAYLKDRKNDPYIDNVVNYLLSVDLK
jgi:DNA-binding transcriptional LysR family regulator